MTTKIDHAHFKTGGKGHTHASKNSSGPTLFRKYSKSAKNHSASRFPHPRSPTDSLDKRGIEGEEWRKKKIHPLSNKGVKKTLFCPPQPKQVNISGKATTNQDVVLDISNVIRLGASAGGSISGLADSPFFANSPFQPLLGLSTFANFFLGAIAAFKASARFFHAKKLEDSVGRIEARLDFWRGVMQSAGGLTFGVYRGTTLAAMLIDGPNVNLSRPTAPTLLGRASFWVGVVGSALFGVFYAVLGAWSIYIDVKEHRFLKKLNAQKEPLQFLQKWLQADKELVLGRLRREFLLEHCHLESDSSKRSEKLQKAEKIDQKIKKQKLSTKQALRLRKKLEAKFFGEEIIQKIDRKIKKHLYRLGLVFGAEGLKKTIQELKSKLPATKLELLENTKTYQKVLRRRFSKKALIRAALDLKVEMLRMKKEKRLERLSSDKSVKKIKNALPVLSRDLASKDKTTQKMAKVGQAELVDGVKKAAQTNRILLWVMIAACALGLAATALSFVFPLGTPALFVLILFLGSGIGMTVFDAYFLHQALKGVDKAKLDSKARWLSTGLCVAAFSLTIALTVMWGFASPPLLFAAVLAVAWIATNVTVAILSKRRRRRILEKQPDCAFFLKALEKKRYEDEKMRRLFARLPQENRVKIRKKVTNLLEKKNSHRSARHVLKYYPQDPLVVEATNATIESIRRKELMRTKALEKALLPLVRKYLPAA